MQLRGFYSRERLRTLGIYLIVILALFRLVLLPLNNAVKDRKVLLTEYLETYRTKTMTLKKQAGEVENQLTPGQKNRLLTSLYSKGSSDSMIQSDVLRVVIKEAEKNGLMMINFELPETLRDPDLSEIPVLVRLKGSPRAMIRLLEGISQMKALTEVRMLQIEKFSEDWVLILTLSAYRTET